MCQYYSFIWRRVAVLLLSLPAVIATWAQVTISGTVKEAGNRPVIGASISLKGTYDGTITDSLGSFQFTTAEKDTQILEVTNTGYKPVVKTLILRTTTPVTINVILKEAPDELKAVTITAGAFAVDDKKRAVTVLNSLDVATIGGGNADISTAMKTLPGAQQVGEQEGLFVRGGTAEETKQFIDGTLVNKPYGTSVPDIASRGRFSPFLFKGMVFSTGGYSALYGQALSSALILESIDMPERSAATLSVSPILLGGGIQQLSKNKKFSWGADYNYTNLVAYFNLVKQTPDYFKMPVFHSGAANFRIKTKGGIIKYYTTFDHSELGLRRQDVDSLALKDAFRLRNNNWYNNLSWRENLGNGWKMNLGAGFSTNGDNLAQQLQDAQNRPVYPDNAIWSYNKNFVLRRDENLSQLRGVFEKRLFGISTLRFGAEHMSNTYRFDYNDTLHVNLKDHYTALFAETDVYLTNHLAAKIGGRLERSSVINTSNFAPRAALAYKLGTDGQISAAYGIFYQRPEYAQLTYTTQLGYQRADHYILNYQKMTNDRIFRIETFYKVYRDLIKSYPVSLAYNFYDNAGSGYAKGAELFWRDKQTFKDIDYWISYSYLDTKRNYLNYPQLLEPGFAAKHTASVVVKRFVTTWKTGFNLTYSFATGRPYYDFRYDLYKNAYTIGDHGKTIPYNNLGLSVNYLPNIGKPKAKVFWVLVASANNVLGNNQVYGYNYSFNGANKIPINPPARRFYFIGIFLSWGVDRTQDAINSNL